MNLQTLAEQLERSLKLPLPGASAHEPMRAWSIGTLRPMFDHKLPAKPGSVLILLYEEDGIIKFPLIKRPQYPGAHSGQISLPGGKAEAGEDVVETALREGEEEIGIDRNQVMTVGRLSNFFVIPSNFLVTPIVVLAYQPPVFRPDAREVERIIIGTLDDLLHKNAIKKEEILVGHFRMMAPHFKVEGEIVWGATAMILNELRIILLEILDRA